MSSPNLEIVICMGSSCFSRGNKKTLPLIQEYLKEKGLESHVLFKGSHCFGECENGPILKIGDSIYRKVDSSNVQDILEQELVGLNTH